MSEKVNSILIAEDQDIARLGLRLTLEKMSGVEVVGEAVDGEAVIDQCDRLHPDIILMDIDLPKVSGIEATKHLKKTKPEIRIIVFTSDSSDDTVFAAIGAGADGYCLKNVSAEQLRTAIDSVSKGAAWLDPKIAHRVLQAQVQAKAKIDKNESDAGKNISGRQTPLLDAQQMDVLQLIGKGMTIEQIASQKHVSPLVIETKLRTILGNVAMVPSQVVNSQGKTPSGNRQPIIPGLILSDRFIIEEKIGVGGVSTVYRGKDLSIGRTVAIKTLNRQNVEDELDVKRFLQEAKAASQISHTNVITIFDFGVTAEKQPYIVMDFIEGGSIEHLLADQKLTLKRTLGIFIQICDALTAAHKKGIIHRDLKPSNIMLVNTDDGSDMVKLVDFGMAKFILESEDLKLTKSGEICGTPTYMSPEHFQGRKLDARSDIYSFGCVLYEALTGNPPFDAVSVFEMMNCHLNEKPSRLPFLRPNKNVPPALESILFGLLEKEPEKRPQSISEVKTALQAVLQTL
jgi:DNA-binding NarL/FixJ family response regulator/tRNA A-37 threonylcarbamoyl transferase component Bud32